MTSPLPSLTDYNNAVDKPERAFATDPVLARGVPDRTALQDPVCATGGFAIMYQIVSGGTRYAVRCFHKQVGGATDQNLTRRYDAIGKFIRRNRHHRFLVDVTYNPRGITVGGHQFPTVRMPFVEGDPLGYWIDDNATNPQALNAVREQINHAVRDLTTLGVAHGDLQHGNIMVGDDDTVCLIDYDGLYLPELAPLGALDAGHINYQHPGRDTAYDAGIDLFAAAVIDLSLDAIAREAELWDDFGDPGDKLLFEAGDFTDPGTSEVLARIESIPALADKVRKLKTACLTDYENVPRALAGASVEPRKAPIKKAPAHLVLAATEAAELRRREGQLVTVHGTVTDTRYLGDKHVAFINFGAYRSAAFTIVAFDNVAKLLREEFGDELEGLEGRSVTMTGYIRLYQSKYSHLPTPQFQLQRIGQMRLENPATGTTSSASPTAPPTTPRSDKRRTTSTSPRGSRSTGPSPSSPTSSRPSDSPTGTTRQQSSSHRTSGSSGDTNWRRTYAAPPPPPPPLYQQPVYRPSFRVGPRAAPPLPPRPFTASRPRRRKARRQLIIAVAVIVVFYSLVISCVAGLDDSPHPTPQTTAAASPPVVFQSPSHNLACRIILDGPSAGVRCDAGTVEFTPPPSDCTESSYGHAIGFAAGAGPAVFLCVSDSLIDQTLPTVQYGDSTSDGPFTCASAENGITCRDSTTGHGLHIERDNFELF